MQRREVALLAALGAVCIVIDTIPWARAASPERTVSVVARKFVFLPREIKLKRGEPVCSSSLRQKP
jgi:hypothetical protein